MSESSDYIYLYGNGYRVVVATNYPLITAMVIDGAGTVVRGHAKCHPMDEFDFDLGTRLATSRALGRYSRKMERRLVRQAR